PDVGAVVRHCRDVTERQAREEALAGIAFTDPRTGLPNSAGLLRAARRALTDQQTPDARTGTRLLFGQLERPAAPPPPACCSSSWRAWPTSASTSAARSSRSWWPRSAAGCGARSARTT